MSSHAAAGLDRLIRPKTIAVIGASSKRPTRGNLVIRNLQKWGFPGRIVPVHHQSKEMEGLPVAPSIEELPGGVDVVFIAVPASGVADVIRRLDKVGVPAAIVISNGFTAAEELELRAVAQGGRILMHGPNCMGLVNVSDSVPLYTAEITAKTRPGKVALLAQSGSAGVAMMNTLEVGVSKMVTLGSEFRLTATDYLRWLAHDDDTSVVGIILESIQHPADFAEAVSGVKAAGKQIVALKVGRSATGMLAAQAHTGSMLTPNDAYDCFFRQCGVPVVADYEQLTAALECMATVKSLPAGPRIGLVGISGGETALACDIAGELDIPLAQWSSETEARIRSSLPGTSGRNPLDLGASVGHDGGSGEMDALGAIAADAGVDMVVAVQDAQASLPPQLVTKYRHTFDLMAAQSQLTGKPIVVISPTPDTIHATLRGDLPDAGVPVLRGLRAGLAATRCLGLAGVRRKRTGVQRSPSANAKPSDLDVLKIEIGRYDGALPLDLCQRILARYEIPFARSAVIRDADDKLPPDVTFPVVAKVSSAQVSHRSDIGGVKVGIADEAALRRAVREIAASVLAARPEAVIDGYEIQEDLTGWVEAMAGFSVAPPFGAMTIVGSGGTLTELLRDRAASLDEIAPDEAVAMIGSTRLGKILAGYRNLIPVTTLAGLAQSVANLSRLAGDLAGSITACDLNPVMVRKGSGEVRAVDVLMVAPRRP